MKYLCLICAEKVMEQMPEADAAKHYEEYPRVHRQHQEKRAPGLGEPAEAAA
jgi:hypothetical protein